MTDTLSPSHAQLWLPMPKRQSFTYLVPEALQAELKPGRLARVGFGRRKTVGLVIEYPARLPLGEFKLRELGELLPEIAGVDSVQLKLWNWVAQHYLAAPGDVLQALLPSGLLQGKMPKAPKPRSEPKIHSHFHAPEVTLNAEQSAVVAAVAGHASEFYPLLLEGITGSGKTEIYLELCKQALSRQGRALILVPEIGLTPQMLGRFGSRFGAEVALYHSDMTPAQRQKSWWAAKLGEKSLFIGTRSALALPIQNLALIVIDEEHDPSYKQDERLRYHARDVAVMLAKLQKIPILLGSATPALESRENAERGKYHHFLLKNRATQGSLPKVQLVDLREVEFKPREENGSSCLSPVLLEKLKNTLERGEQALLFLNRRGYAPSRLCHDCGTVPRCPNCDIALTYYRKNAFMHCHYCDLKMPAMPYCSACSSPRWENLGTGTEKLELELQTLFPTARIGRLDREIATSRQKSEDILGAFAQGELDMLVGTQLVTKGHDFAKLTLVGILLADLSLNIPDFRAAERLFQTLTQVAGRAGRHDLAGEVILQTYRPEHFAIQCALAQDAERFFIAEKVQRAARGYPPYGRLVALRFSSLQDRLAQAGAEQFVKALYALPQMADLSEILGPAPSTLHKLRGKFRWQILLRTRAFAKLRPLLAQHLADMEAALPRGVQLTVDVDPVGVL